MDHDKTLESQLFSWEGWDIIDNGDFSFYDVKLKVDIGQHKAGDTFKSVAFMMTSSVLEFYDSEGEIISTHKLKISTEDI